MQNNQLDNERMISSNSETLATPPRKKPVSQDLMHLSTSLFTTSDGIHATLSPDTNFDDMVWDCPHCGRSTKPAFEARLTHVCFSSDNNDDCSIFQEPQQSHQVQIAKHEQEQKHNLIVMGKGSNHKVPSKISSLISSSTVEPIDSKFVSSHQKRGSSIKTMITPNNIVPFMDESDSMQQRHQQQDVHRTDKIYPAPQWHKKLAQQQTRSSKEDELWLSSFDFVHDKAESYVDMSEVISRERMEREAMMAKVMEEASKDEERILKEAQDAINAIRKAAAVTTQRLGSDSDSTSISSWSSNNTSRSSSVNSNSPSQDKNGAPTEKVILRRRRNKNKEPQLEDTPSNPPTIDSATIKLSIENNNLVHQESRPTPHMISDCLTQETNSSKSLAIEAGSKIGIEVKLASSPVPAQVVTEGSLLRNDLQEQQNELQKGSLQEYNNGVRSSRENFFLNKKQVSFSDFDFQEEKFTPHSRSRSSSVGSSGNGSGGGLRSEVRRMRGEGNRKKYVEVHQRLKRLDRVKAADYGARKAATLFEVEKGSVQVVPPELRTCSTVLGMEELVSKLNAYLMVRVEEEEEEEEELCLVQNDTVNLFEKHQDNISSSSSSSSSIEQSSVALPLTGDSNKENISTSGTESRKVSSKTRTKSKRYMLKPPNSTPWLCTPPQLLSAPPPALIEAYSSLLSNQHQNMSEIQPLSNKHPTKTKKKKKKKKKKNKSMPQNKKQPTSKRTKLKEDQQNKMKGISDNADRSEKGLVRIILMKSPLTMNMIHHWNSHPKLPIVNIYNLQFFNHSVGIGKGIVRGKQNNIEFDLKQLDDFNKYSNYSKSELSDCCKWVLSWTKKDVTHLNKLLCFKMIKHLNHHLLNPIWSSSFVCLMRSAIHSLLLKQNRKKLTCSISSFDISEGLFNRMITRTQQKQQKIRRSSSGTKEEDQGGDDEIDNEEEDYYISSFASTLSTLIVDYACHEICFQFRVYKIGKVYAEFVKVCVLARSASIKQTTHTEKGDEGKFHHRLEALSALYRFIGCNDFMLSEDVDESLVSEICELARVSRINLAS